MSTYLDFISKAVRAQCECVCTHARTVPVKEVFEGKVIWAGDVEVFQLYGHPKAALAYAWGYPPDNPKTGHVVLGIPPVFAAEDAVKVFIASEIKKAPTPKH